MPIPQSHPSNAPSPNWCAGRKVTEAHKAWLWKVLNDDPTCPSRLVLHTIAETQEPIAVTLRQSRNYSIFTGFWSGSRGAFVV
jgi:hypothetical protein